MFEAFVRGTVKAVPFKVIVQFAELVAPVVTVNVLISLTPPRTYKIPNLVSLRLLVLPYPK